MTAKNMKVIISKNRFEHFEKTLKARHLTSSQIT